MSPPPSDVVPANVPESESLSAFSASFRRMISYLKYPSILLFKSQEIGALPITIQVCQARQAREEKIQAPPGGANQAADSVRFQKEGGIIRSV